MPAEHIVHYVVGNVNDWQQVVEWRGRNSTVRLLESLSAVRSAVINPWDQVHYGRAFFLWSVSERREMYVAIDQARARGKRL